MQAGDKGVIWLRGTEGRGTYAVCRGIAAPLWISAVLHLLMSWYVAGSTRQGPTDGEGR